MSFNHAVIWIDHKEAHVMFLSQEASEAEVIKTKSTHAHLHHKANEVGSGKATLDVKYLHAVISAVKEAKEILILGPGSAKLDLIKHAHQHDQQIAAKIIGVETVDHPSDKEILAFARRFFYKADQML
jgi:stalled ribosome rescue protein Dom34